MLSFNAFVFSLRILYGLHESINLVVVFFQLNRSFANPGFLAGTSYKIGMVIGTSGIAIRCARREYFLRDAIQFKPFFVDWFLGFLKEASSFIDCAMLTRNFRYHDILDFAAERVAINPILLRAFLYLCLSISLCARAKFCRVKSDPIPLHIKTCINVKQSFVLFAHVLKVSLKCLWLRASLLHSFGFKPVIRNIVNQSPHNRKSGIRHSDLRTHPSSQDLPSASGGIAYLLS